MGLKLTNEDFCRASKRLRCEVAAIKVVDDTESKGAGFYADGFPTILFERHKFRKFTGGRYNATHPEISGPAGGYGRPGANQKRKFNIAFALDPAAAMKSCSWGRYQIMGFNHEACGFATVGAFVDAMKESEGRQLDAFVAFVIHEHLADELRGHDWAGFAHGYNGADYKKNRYDTKMATAYKRFAKEEIDCSAADLPAPESVESAEVPSEETPATTITDPTSTPEAQAQPDSVITQPLISKPTIWERITGWQEKADKVNSVKETFTAISPGSKWSFATTKIGGWLIMALGFFTDHWIWIVAGVVLVALALWYLKGAKDRANARTIPALTQAQTVVVKT